MILNGTEDGPGGVAGDDTGRGCFAVAHRTGIGAVSYTHLDVYKRQVLEQQETEARKRPPNDPLHQALLDLQNNRQEEVQALSLIHI